QPEGVERRALGPRGMGPDRVAAGRRHPVRADADPGHLLAAGRGAERGGVKSAGVWPADQLRSVLIVMSLSERRAPTHILRIEMPLDLDANSAAERFDIEGALAEALKLITSVAKVGTLG